jgi:ketosteroid isomerase-like protein
MVRAIFAASALFTLAACRTGDPGPQIRALLDEQARQWNAGNLAGFMAAYWSSEQTRFLSGGDVTVGWQTVFDRYRRRYPDRAAMGTLTFSQIEVAALAPAAALASGRWRLDRAGDQPSGLFTLLVRKTPQGWRIVHDHTSLAENKK